MRPPRPARTGQRNRAKLFEAHKKRRVMFACQLDPHLLEARNAGGFADLYPAFGVGLTVHGDLITQMLEQHPSERAAPATGQAVIAIGVASVGAQPRSPRCDRGAHGVDGRNRPVHPGRVFLLARPG
jgi:hypothetical protein